MKISIIAATTIDGKIAKTSKHFPDWTGNSDKKMFAEVTKQAGVVIMSSKTFDTMSNFLPKRKIFVMTRNKDREYQQKDLIFTTDTAESIIKKIKKQGFKKILICGGSQINYLFLAKGLVDELIITFSPLLFGKGISLLSEHINLSLKLKSFKLIDNNSICAIYKIIK